jgi:acyl-CoA hydrolase
MQIEVHGWRKQRSVGFAKTVTAVVATFVAIEDARRPTPIIRF